MAIDNEWDFVRIERPSRVAEAGISIIRATLLFGSAAIALALIILPFVDKTERIGSTDATIARGLDMMSTGSVKNAGTSYTLRRSVLQPSPGAVCIIGGNGSRSGDC